MLSPHPSASHDDQQTCGSCHCGWFLTRSAAALVWHNACKKGGFHMTRSDSKILSHRCERVFQSRAPCSHVWDCRELPWPACHRARASVYRPWLGAHGWTVPMGAVATLTLPAIICRPCVHAPSVAGCPCTRRVHSKRRAA